MLPTVFCSISNKLAASRSKRVEQEEAAKINHELSAYYRNYRRAVGDYAECCRHDFRKATWDTTTWQNSRHFDLYRCTPCGAEVWKRISR